MMEKQAVVTRKSSETNVALQMLEAVIPAKTGIQFRKTGFPRIKYGAGLVTPGMKKQSLG
jgi:hypothetical protein